MLAQTPAGTSANASCASFCSGTPAREHDHKRDVCSNIAACTKQLCQAFGVLCRLGGTRVVISECTTFKSTAPALVITMSRQVVIICSVDTGVFVNTAARCAQESRSMGATAWSHNSWATESNAERSSACEEHLSLPRWKSKCSTLETRPSGFQFSQTHWVSASLV